MKDNSQVLEKRLGNIWEPPDLFSFFKKFAKRPARFYRKGTIIFSSDDPLSGVFFIEEGFVKLYRVSDEGRETVIYLTGPGNLLGLRALLSESECAHHYTEALTDVKIYNMKRSEYLEVLKEHPEFLVDLVHMYVERLNHTEQRLEGFIATDSISRIAVFLHDLSSRFGKKNAKKEIEIPLPMTHQRIGEFVGAFRETVSVAVKRLQNEKVLKMERGKVIILNPKRLESYATAKR